MVNNGSTFTVGSFYKYLATAPHPIKRPRHRSHSLPITTDRQLFFFLHINRLHGGLDGWIRISLLHE